MAVVADDPGDLAVAAVVCARGALNAVCQRALLAAALHVVHVNRTASLAEVRHYACLGLPAVWGIERDTFRLDVVGIIQRK